MRLENFERWKQSFNHFEQTKDFGLSFCGNVLQRLFRAEQIFLFSTAPQTSRLSFQMLTTLRNMHGSRAEIHKPREGEDNGDGEGEDEESDCCLGIGTQRDELVPSLIRQEWGIRQSNQLSAMYDSSGFAFKP